MTLFPSLQPMPVPASIDLRCGDVRELVKEVRGADLVMADPPWGYRGGPGVANPEANGIYNGMADAEIAAILDSAYDCAKPGARLVCWATWPKLVEFLSAGGAGSRWRYVTGGAWLKQPHVGVGHHWRGWTEPALVFTKPGVSSYLDRGVWLGNGHASIPEEHSRKPVAWLRGMVRAWSPPGALVLDLWAGLAPLASACLAEGRNYCGAEIDPNRWADARRNVARGGS